MAAAPPQVPGTRSDVRSFSRDDVRALIETEAKELGLSYAEAHERYRRGTLPRTAIGADLKLLFGLLAR